MSLWTLLLLAHLLGLALGMGSATVKLVLLAGCAHNEKRLSAYLEVIRPITRLIILGLVLLTLSGLGWLLLGYPLSTLLLLKLAVVTLLWLLGPLIDHWLEPSFIRLAPQGDDAPSPAFVHVRRQLLAVEALATGLFYLITLLGILL